MGISRIAAVLLGAGSILLMAAGDDTPRRGSALEEDVLESINHARRNPRAYAEELRQYRRYFDGDLLFLPGRPNGVITREGVDAVDEAIDFLERQAPLPPLDAGEVLALAALDHAEAQGEIGELGHASRAGASPGERVRRRGGDIYVGESISYGHDSAEGVVRQMIVDDGVPGRGHRKLLFGGEFRFAGVGCGSHRRHGHMCVVDLSATRDGAPRLPQWAKSSDSGVASTAVATR